MICDVVWKLRNQVQFQGVSPNLDGILLKISRSVAEFKVLDIPMGLTSNMIQSAWSKPDRDTIKINVNATCNIKISDM